MLPNVYTFCITSYKILENNAIWFQKFWLINIRQHDTPHCRIICCKELLTKTLSHLISTDRQRWIFRPWCNWWYVVKNSSSKIHVEVKGKSSPKMDKLENIEKLKNTIRLFQFMKISSNKIHLLYVWYIY